MYLPHLHQQTETPKNQLTSGVTNPQQWLLDAVSGGRTSSGNRVGVSEALSLSAVWASIKRIAGDIGKLHVEVRRPTDGEYKTSKLIPHHPAARVLNGPNERQTGQVFRETMMANALLQGNGKAYIERNTLGQPVELLLIPPAYSYTMMWEGEKWHILNLPAHYVGNDALGGLATRTAANGGPPDGWYRIPDRDILHIPGLSYDGLWGIDVLHNSRDIFGLDAAGRDAGGYNFRNNGRPGLILEAPRNAFSTAKQAQEFISAINREHQGLDNIGKTMLMREGMKPHVLNTSQVDSQQIESRHFSREDIALLFGTETIMGAGSAVYKDRQDRLMAYLQGTLGAWFERWNQESQRKLFSARDVMAGVYLDFDVWPLISGDPNTLADYTGKLVQQKVVSVNEVRAMHRLNPVQGGDEVIAPEPEPGAEQDEAEQEAEAKEEVQEDEPQAKLVARAAVLEVFERLIADEVNRVRANSRKDDFETRWMTVYEHQRQKLTSKCQAFGIDEELAERHCGESEDWLADAVYNGGGDIPATVTEITKNWKQRAEVFADAI